MKTHTSGQRSSRLASGIHIPVAPIKRILGMVYTLQNIDQGRGMSELRPNLKLPI